MPTSAPAPLPGLPPGVPPSAEARRELVATWALAIGLLAVAALASLGAPFLRQNLAGVAAFLFIALPDRRLAARGEAWPDHGVPWFGARDPRTWRAWGRGAAQALLVCAIVFPLFVAAFWAYAELLPHLPRWAARNLAPYAGLPRFHLRLPPGFAERVVTQLLVVALPEELFYRGWMQSRWERIAPERGVTVLGARLGEGFLWTQLLFAAGHLVVPQPWRLATFFPGVLFGWLRARTGSIAAPVFVHALSNLFIAVLERSFYG